MAKKIFIVLILAILGVSAAYYADFPNKDFWASIVKTDPLLCKSDDSLCAEFKQIAPLPDWWDEVDPGSVEISDYDELLSYWQSEKRCCTEQEIKLTNRQFFKAAYLEIIAHTDSPDIVVNAISMMDLSYLDYDNFYPLTMFALKHYPDYNKPLHACANCKTGDVIASLLIDLRLQMARKNLNQEYIDLTQGFLQKRGREMSDYYEARVYLALARSYKDSRQTSKATEILAAMPETYADSPPSGALTSTLRDAKILLKQLTPPQQQTEQQPEQTLHPR